MVIRNRAANSTRHAILRVYGT